MTAKGWHDISPEVRAANQVKLLRDIPLSWAGKVFEQEPTAENRQELIKALNGKKQELEVERDSALQQQKTFQAQATGVLALSLLIYRKEAERFPIRTKEILLTIP